MNRLTFALLAFAYASMLAASFPLTLEGRPAAAIVVGRWTEQREHTAAMRLRDHVLHISGAELPILVRTYPDCEFLRDWQPGSRLPEVAPYGALRPVFISHDDSLAEEEFRLEVAETHIRICGGSAAGLLYGVDELMERLGVTWPAKERLWLERPQTADLSVETCEVASRPFFRIRAVHHHQTDSALFAWMGFNRLNYRLENPPGWYESGMMAEYGVSPFFISHSWSYWVPTKELVKHPEWNPLVDGQRKLPNENDDVLVHHQLCISNPKVREYMLGRILAYLKDNPQMRTVALEANDGGGYCECDGCKAYGATTSEQFFRFVAEVAETIREAQPQVTVLVYSYGAHRALPSVRLPENVCIGVTLNDRNYARPLKDPVNEKEYARLLEWAQAYPARVFVYELWSKVWFENYPHPYARVLAEDMRLYRDLKLAGLCPEGIHPSPFVEYLRGRLAWNPEQDWKELLDEFCVKMFGEASEPMAKYYLLLEERMGEFGGNLQNLTAISDFTEPIDKEAFALLNQAAAASRTESQQARVAWERSQFMKLHSILEQWMPCTRDVVTDEIRARNLLVNGDFEDGLDHVTESVMQGEYRFNVLSDDAAYHGEKCAAITVVKRGWARLVLNAANLDTSKRYAIYCAVKTEDGAEMGNLWYVPGGHPAEIFMLGDTHGQWYRVVFRNIEIHQGVLGVYLTAQYLPTKGRLLWDDVILVPED